MSKFYGLIKTTGTRTEEYEKRLKNGKTVTKTRTVTFPADKVVESSQSDRLGARKELEQFARMCKGSLEWIRAYK